MHCMKWLFMEGTWTCLNYTIEVCDDGSFEVLGTKQYSPNFWSLKAAKEFCEKDYLGTNSREKSALEMMELNHARTCEEFTRRQNG